MTYDPGRHADYYAGVGGDCPICRIPQMIRDLAFEGLLWAIAILFIWIILAS